MNEDSSSTNNKRSWIALLIIFSALALSVAALFLAYTFFPETMDYYWLFLGVLGATLSIYILFQARRKMKSLDIEPPTIMTTVECRKCGFKNIREFERGDYIFKEMEPCQKCDENMLITAIYREASEKEGETSF
ncbi:MAG: hypothetical protein ACOC6G_01300 [Thermoproteota archaeon]